MKNDPMDKFVSWTDRYPDAFGKSLSVVVLMMGVLMIIGAIKNWDWLYAPDSHYRSNWNMGQVSRYLGRNTARIWGAIVGAFILLPIGLLMVYSKF